MAIARTFGTPARASRRHSARALRACRVSARLPPVTRSRLVRHNLNYVTKRVIDRIIPFQAQQWSTLYQYSCKKNTRWQQNCGADVSYSEVRSTNVPWLLMCGWTKRTAEWPSSMNCPRSLFCQIRWWYARHNFSVKSGWELRWWYARHNAMIHLNPLSLVESWLYHGEGQRDMWRTSPVV